MLDQLKQLFNETLQYTHTAGVLQQMANLLQIVGTQFMKDETGKNVALDIICEVLQSHKDPVVEVSENAPN